MDTRTLRRRIRADRARWAQARTLADVGELTALWLEGEIIHQAAYCDPDPGEETGPDPETRDLVPVLAACNRAGFVTDCSQPARRGDGWAQRAAVSGFADDETCARLRDLADAAGLECITERATAVRIVYATAECVSTERGRPVTSFGARLSRRHIASRHVGYGECHRDAVRALCGAWQVTIIEPEWDRNDRLWPALEAFAQER